jgi:glutathione synthase/RimK-type ligase-like ATP-grasp enzyme
MRIGFFTAEFLGGVFADDVPVAEALASRGVEVEPVVWNRPFDARRYVALVVRSPWDWYQHRAAFRAFVRGLASAPTRVINPPQMLARFMDKTYFEHLTRLGLDVMPTTFFTPEQLDEVPAELARRGWRRAVLKPSFTANAYGAQRFEASRVDDVVAAARAQVVDSAWMLQPYVEGIEAGGEWSLVFFGGVFSHAVQKRPKAGDYRVQPDHGGASALATPAPDVIAAAQRVISVAVPDSLYARVDGVEHEGRFRLMELEVVEPELFLRLHPPAATRFAEVLLRQVSADARR